MAADVLGEVKETAREKLGEQKGVAASGLAEFAGALRSAAHQVDQRNPTVAHVAETAAERLERLARTLQSRDLDGIVRETESFARREPMVFVGAAVVAGFLAIRLLKTGAAQAAREQGRL